MCPIADAAKGFLTAAMMLKALQMSVLVMKWDLGWVGNFNARQGGKQAQVCELRLDGLTLNPKP